MVVDGDAKGQKVVSRLRHDYELWPEEHFRTWTRAEFERYYPAKFADRATEVLALPHGQHKQTAKKDLLNDVKAWCDSDQEAAKAAFKESAAEVIDFLGEVDRVLFGRS